MNARSFRDLGSRCFVRGGVNLTARRFALGTELEDMPDQNQSKNVRLPETTSTVTVMPGLISNSRLS